MSQQLKIVCLTLAVLIDTRHWQAACSAPRSPEAFSREPVLSAHTPRGRQGLAEFSRDQCTPLISKNKAGPCELFIQ